MYMFFQNKAPPTLELSLPNFDHESPESAVVLPSLTLHPINSLWHALYSFPRPLFLLGGAPKEEGGSKEKTSQNFFFIYSSFHLVFFLFLVNLSVFLPLFLPWLTLFHTFFPLLAVPSFSPPPALPFVAVSISLSWFSSSDRSFFSFFLPLSYSD